LKFDDSRYVGRLERQKVKRMVREKEISVGSRVRRACVGNNPLYGNNDECVELFSENFLIYNILMLFLLGCVLFPSVILNGEDNIFSMVLMCLFFGEAFILCGTGIVKVFSSPIAYFGVSGNIVTISIYDVKVARRIRESDIDVWLKNYDVRVVLK